MGTHNVLFSVGPNHSQMDSRHWCNPLLVVELEVFQLPKNALNPNGRPWAELKGSLCLLGGRRTLMGGGLNETCFCEGWGVCLPRLGWVSMALQADQNMTGSVELCPNSNPSTSELKHILKPNDHRVHSQPVILWPAFISLQQHFTSLNILCLWNFMQIGGAAMSQQGVGLDLMRL